MAAASMSRNALPATVGLEIHARLLTGTKLFCRCANRYGDAPNRNTCPVCLGLPGSLPVLQAGALNLALRVGLALDCRINEVSRFDRKNYFYPDLPRNYQITQFDRPLCVGGQLNWNQDGITQPVGLRRIHLEEDAGRSVVGRGQPTRVDLNRAGTPLVEIVTEPDLSGGHPARLWLQGLRRLLVSLEVCDGNMEEGSLRCDANIGLQGVGDGPWTEVKNLNSFRAVARAVDHEIDRLRTLVAAGETLRRQTRSWDERTGATRLMRHKEREQDYRYFPEPDLPLLTVDPARLETLREQLPELPEARCLRLQSRHDLAGAEADLICQWPRLADYFEKTMDDLLPRLHEGSAGKVPAGRLTAGWICTETLSGMSERDLRGGSFPVPPVVLAELLWLLSAGRISRSTAKTVHAEYLAGTSGDESPEQIVRRLDLGSIADPVQVREICWQVLEAAPSQVKQWLQGKENLFEFFVGRVMAASSGRIAPEAARQCLKSLLLARRDDSSL